MARESAAQEALEADVWDFVQKGAAYYRQKWLQAPAQFGERCNWSFFAFDLYWLLYRKLYVEAAVFFAAYITLVAGISIWMLEGQTTFFHTIQYIFFTPGLLTREIGVPQRFALAAYGNRLYYKKFMRIRQRADEQKLTGEARRSYLRRRGGVSVASVAVAVAIYLGLAVYSVTVLSGYWQ